MKQRMNLVLSYIMAVLLLLGNLCFPEVTAQAAEAVASATNASEDGFPSISSSSYIIMDAENGQILYEKDSHQRQYPASITKILTSYLAIKNGDLNSTITMSEDAVWGIDRDSSHIALDVGEEIRMSDALYAVMLVSANEAAWAIAEQVAGSLDQFVQLMNDTAQQLGCKDTHFTNANGLHDENHYTTAYDMALITKEALKDETFCSYASETYHEIPPTNMKSETRYLTQSNKMMLSDSEYYYPSCTGGKTGYTEDAGGTLVVWAEKNDMKLICVTMGAADNAANYQDSIALFNYVFDHYSKVTPLTDFEFNAEDATKAQNFLNNYYGCENLGVMHLSVDTSQSVIMSDSADFSKLETVFTPSSDRLDDGYVGTLSISYDGMDCLTLPVSYSGYVNSRDQVAVEEAYKNGEIRPALLEKKSHVKIIITVIVGLLIFSILFLFLYANIIEPMLRKRKIRNDKNQRDNNPYRKR